MLVGSDASYDPFKNPPNIELAKKHGIARRVCMPPEKKNNITDLCPCKHFVSIILFENIQ